MCRVSWLLLVRLNGLDRLPEDDPGERLMLARWCLNLHMTGKPWCNWRRSWSSAPTTGRPGRCSSRLPRPRPPGFRRADARSTRRCNRLRAEEVAEDRPGALDSAVLRGAAADGDQRGTGDLRAAGPAGEPACPAIPAIRPPGAPDYCAKCHNADYNGPFQLLSASNPRRGRGTSCGRTWTRPCACHREDPAKSELLSSTLRPHGQGGRRRPIFSGEHRACQVLATWANSLRVAEGRRPSPAGNRAAADDDEEFAADRNRVGLAGLDPVIRGMKTGDPRQISAMARPAAQEAAGRAYRFVEGQGMVAEDPQQADPHEFPLPFMLGGPARATHLGPPPRARRVADRQQAGPARRREIRPRCGPEWTMPTRPTTPAGIPKSRETPRPRPTARRRRNHLRSTRQSSRSCSRKTPIALRDSDVSHEPRPGRVVGAELVARAGHGRAGTPDQMFSMGNGGSS